MVRLTGQPKSTNIQDHTMWGPWAAGQPLKQYEYDHFDFSPYEYSYIKKAKDKGAAIQELLFQRALGATAPSMVERPDPNNYYPPPYPKKK